MALRSFGALRALAFAVSALGDAPPGSTGLGDRKEWPSDDQVFTCMLGCPKSLLSYSPCQKSTRTMRGARKSVYSETDSCLPIDPAMSIPRPRVCGSFQEREKSRNNLV